MPCQGCTSPSGATCNTGQCGCPGNQQNCNNQCTDTSSDKHNCGMCTHDCLGGACSNGTCQPVSVASQLGQSNGIALDSNYVYWANITGPQNGPGSVMKCALVGCTTPTKLATGSNAPWDVAVNGSYVFWTGAGDGSINRANLDGTNQKAIVTGQFGPWPIAIDGSFVYWGENVGSGVIGKAAFDGTGVQNLATGQADTQALIVVNGLAIWANVGSMTVASCATGGCGLTPNNIATSANTAYVAADGNYVYWTDYTASAVRRAGLNGSNPTSLVTGQSDCNGPIVVDAQGIYWEANGNIMRAALDGTQVKVLAPSQSTTNGLAVNATAVYWSNILSGGSVEMVAK
jgi:hypothetical protein